MVYGLRVEGDAGVIQIDENYINMSLTQKLVFTGGFTQSGSAAKTVSFSVSNPVNPAVALETEGGYALAFITGTTGFNYTILCSQNVTKVTCYIFDEITNPPMTGFGLMVRKDNGQVVYHTDYKPLRVVGFIRNVTGYGAGGLGDYTYVAGRRYALISSRTGFWGDAVVLGVGTPPFQVMVITGRQGGGSIPNGVTLQNFPINVQTLTTSSSIPPPPTRQGVDWLVVDVTNY